MALTAQSKKASESAAQACKAVAEAKTTTRSMAESAATIAAWIGESQAEAEELVFNKKMVEIQEQMKTQQISSDKKYLDTADQMKALLAALARFPGKSVFCFS